MCRPSSGSRGRLRPGRNDRSDVSYRIRWRHGCFPSAAVDLVNERATAHMVPHMAFDLDAIVEDAVDDGVPAGAGENPFVLVSIKAALW